MIQVDKSPVDMFPKLFLCAMATFLVAIFVFPSPAGAAQMEGQVNVAMLLWRGETDAEKGFMETFRKKTEAAGGIVNFDIFNAVQDKAKLAKIIDQLDVSKYQLVYTFGTTVTKLAQLRIKGTPIVFNAVSRPLKSGIILSWTHSGYNISGVSSSVSIMTVYDYLASIAPSRAPRHLKIGFIYNPAEENSRIQKEELSQACIIYGCDIVTSELTGPEDIQIIAAIMEEAEVDLVILPDDSMVAVHASALVEAFSKRKIPTMAFIPQLAKENGAMIGVGPDYYHLGEMAAQIAYAIVKGERATDIASRRPEHVRKIINLKTAKAVGITIPEAALADAETIQ